MCLIPEDFFGFKTFGNAAKQVLIHCIVNADSVSDQKCFIITAYESGLFSVSETFALLASLGISAE